MKRLYRISKLERCCFVTYNEQTDHCIHTKERQLVGWLVLFIFFFSSFVRFSFCWQNKFSKLNNVASWGFCCCYCLVFSSFVKVCLSLLVYLFVLDRFLFYFFFILFLYLFLQIFFYFVRLFVFKFIENPFVTYSISYFLLFFVGKTF